MPWRLGRVAIRSSSFAIGIGVSAAPLYDRVPVYSLDQFLRYPEIRQIIVRCAVARSTARLSGETAACKAIPEYTLMVFIEDLLRGRNSDGDSGFIVFPAEHDKAGNSILIECLAWPEYGPVLTC